VDTLSIVSHFMPFNFTGLWVLSTFICMECCLLGYFAKLMFPILLCSNCQKESTHKLYITLILHVYGCFSCCPTFFLIIDCPMPKIYSFPAQTSTQKNFRLPNKGSTSFGDWGHGGGRWLGSQFHLSSVWMMVHCCIYNSFICLKGHNI